MSGEWKCAECGKPAYHLLDKKGICCSPELREQNRLAAESEQHRRDLLWALQTRPLTDEEMGRVASYDYYLLVRPMVPFTETEVRKQFGNMLVNQFRLRQLAQEKK